MSLEPSSGEDDVTFCYQNADRVCGGDCTAYVQNTPSEPDYRDAPWAHCLLLLSQYRMGKHATVLAQKADKLVQLRIDERRDMGGKK